MSKVNVAPSRRSLFDRPSVAIHGEMPVLTGRFGLVLLPLLLVSAGCGDSSRGGGRRSARTVRIDGSSTVYLITEAVAEEFQAQHPRTRVTVGISGSGGGFQKFCIGETDISDASREINDRELETCLSNGIVPIELVTSLDGPSSSRRSGVYR